MIMLTPISAPLLEHINFAIKNRKNKTKVLKNIYKEYQITELSDLTEKDGDELLHILDEEAYHLYQFDEHVKNNPSKYLEIHKSYKYRVISKKISVSVYSVNDNSIFQPLETIEKHSYLAVVVIELLPSTESCHYLSKIKNLANLIKICSWANAIDLLEKFT
jgi:hypothetical protein